MPVLRRVISDGVTVDIWFTPAKPVRNAVTRSLRGRFVGARFAKLVPSVWLTAPRNSASSNAGNVGFVTYVPNWPSKRGSLALKRSLSGRPITSSLTSGMPRRETCTHGPPSTSGRANVGSGFSRRAWRSEALVQPPMTPLPLPVRQLLCSSSAIVVTLASSTLVVGARSA